MTGLRPDLPGQVPEERSVSGPRALEAEGPRVGGLVTQRVFPLRRWKVRRDRDRMRRSIENLASRELAARKTHAGRLQAEPRGEAVVKKLKPLLVAQRLDFEKRAHRIRLTCVSLRNREEER